MATVFDDSLASRSGGFLFGVQQELLGPDKQHGLRLQARFDLARFSTDLFDILDIARPETLVRAIDKRLGEFLAGRALAQVAQSALGRSPESVGIGPDGAPVWPEGLAGSISHAHGRCVCLLLPSDKGQPGVDIESVANRQGLEAIMRSTVNAAESTKLHAAPDMAAAATLCFSGKETLYKALSPTVGRFFGFNSAELRALPRANRLTLFLTENLHPELPAGKAFDIAYVAKRDHVVTWLVYQPQTATHADRSSKLWDE
jgi:enterobactin synthetase component D